MTVHASIPLPLPAVQPQHDEAEHADKHEGRPRCAVGGVALIHEQVLGFREKPELWGAVRSGDLEGDVVVALVQVVNHAADEAKFD